MVMVNERFVVALVMSQLRSAVIASITGSVSVVVLPATSTAIVEYASDQRAHPEPCAVRRPAERLGPSAPGKAAPFALQAVVLHRSQVASGMTSCPPTSRRLPA